eukprot:2658165-Pyramimonas_sp.AAC.3
MRAIKELGGKIQVAREDASGVKAQNLQVSDRALEEAHASLLLHEYRIGLNKVVSALLTRSYWPIRWVEKKHAYYTTYDT